MNPVRRCRRCRIELREPAWADLCAQCLAYALLGRGVRYFQRALRT